MRYLAPFLLVVTIFPTIQLQAGETSIEAALEKARQRAGGPAPDTQARQQKAREAAQQAARDEAARKQREEAARKARAEKSKAAANGADPAAKKAEAIPPAKPRIRVFTLKDGRQIQAVMVVELDDTYALKDKDGTLEEIKKVDVKSVQDAE